MPRVMTNNKLNNFLCKMHKDEGQRTRKNRNKKIDEFMNIRRIQLEMIQEAQTKNPGCKILPCGCRKSLDECFTEVGDDYMFWFNVDKNKSTQAIKRTVIWRVKNVENEEGCT